MMYDNIINLKLELNKQTVLMFLSAALLFISIISFGVFTVHYDDDAEMIKKRTKDTESMLLMNIENTIAFEKNVVIGYLFTNND